mmetsp:Transcript_61414/g.179507  ORF Transcript_61414/g.179507 Transcript_61414/m.179507 type:complete len:537 (-) Transcript_61414:337-1947(-)
MEEEAENPGATLSPLADDAELGGGCARSAEDGHAKAAEAGFHSKRGHHPATPGCSPRVWPAAVSLFLHMAAMSLAMPLYSDVLLLDPLVTSSNAPTDHVRGARHLFSIAIGLNAFFELVTSGMLGVLSDRLGRRPVAVLTQVGQFVDYSVAAVIAPAVFERGGELHSVGVVVIAARVFSGLCGNLKIPLQAYIADLSLDGMAVHNFSQASIASGLALVAGPSLSLLVLRTIGGQLRLVIGTAAGLSLLNILLICCTWPRSTPVQTVSWREANPYCLLKRTVMRTKQLEIFGWMNLLDAFAVFFMLSTIPLFTKTRYGWSLSMLSLFLLVIGLLTPVQMFAVMRPLLRRSGEVVILKLGYLASCLAYAAMFFAGLADTGMAFFSTTLVFSLGLISNPTHMGMAVREMPPEEYGRLAGGLSLLETLGRALAPLVGGMAFDLGVKWDLPSLLYLVAAVLMLPGMLLACGVQALNRSVVVRPPIQPPVHRRHGATMGRHGLAAPAATAVEVADGPESSSTAAPEPVLVARSREVPSVLSI